MRHPAREKDRRDFAAGRLVKRSSINRFSWKPFGGLSGNLENPICAIAVRVDNADFAVARWR
jgi:hypothetical protein